MNSKIEIQKKYSVSGEKYYEALQEIEKERKNITELNLSLQELKNASIAEINALEAKYHDFEEQLIDLRNKNDLDQTVLEKLSKRRFPNEVKGKWDVNIQDRKGSVTECTFEFSENHVSIIHKRKFDYQQGQIDYYDFDYNSNSIHIFVHYAQKPEPNNFQYFRLQRQTENFLEGHVLPEGLQIKFNRVIKD